MPPKRRTHHPPGEPRTVRPLERHEYGTPVSPPTKLQLTHEIRGHLTRLNEKPTESRVFILTKKVGGKERTVGIVEDRWAHGTIDSAGRESDEALHIREVLQEIKQSHRDYNVIVAHCHTRALGEARGEVWWKTLSDQDVIAARSYRAGGIEDFGLVTPERIFFWQIDEHGKPVERVHELVDAPETQTSFVEFFERYQDTNDADHSLLELVESEGRITTTAEDPDEELSVVEQITAAIGGGGGGGKKKGKAAAAKKKSKKKAKGGGGMDYKHEQAGNLALLILIVIVVFLVLSFFS